ncbi:hypothetical protein LZ32DRAFT_54320 [Colletotrichum eremochloae]|nr:hypothetical protein LZ32DRAFT_54320 [Colletotrichum eremochloae]
MSVAVRLFFFFFVPAKGCCGHDAAGNNIPPRPSWPFVNNIRHIPIGSVRYDRCFSMPRAGLAVPTPLGKAGWIKNGNATSPLMIGRHARSMPSSWRTCLSLSNSVVSAVLIRSTLPYWGGVGSQTTSCWFGSKQNASPSCRSSDICVSCQASAPANLRRYIITTES